MTRKKKENKGAKMSESKEIWDFLDELERKCHMCQYKDCKQIAIKKITGFGWFCEKHFKELDDDVKELFDL